MEQVNHAALEALVEADEKEWVELDKGTRISRDGKTVEWFDEFCSGGEPKEGTYQAWTVQSYRAGLRVGREQAVELAEAVRAAREALEDIADMDISGQNMDIALQMLAREALAKLEAER